MGLLVLTVVLGNLSSGEEPADWFSTAVLVGMTGFATVGALVASRHPRNPIGWLFSAIAFGVVLVGFRETYVVYALFTSAGSLPGATVVAWRGGGLALLAAATAAVPLIGIASVFAGVDLGNLVFPSFFLLILIGIPVASGIAILKYRVLDLDIVIKKTVVFGAVVVLVTAVYLAVVVLVGPRVGNERSGVASLAATI